MTEKCAKRSIRHTLQSPILYVLNKVIKDHNNDEAISVCEKLYRRGMGSTVGYWNDRNDTPRKITDINLEALSKLSCHAPKSYLSVKAPPLHYSRELSYEMAARANEIGIRLHFDAHGPETCSSTFKLIDSLLPTMPRIGCTLPGRWDRSLADADWAIERQLYVRVVKGAWRDVQGNSINLRTGFLNVIDRLAGKAPHVSIATHDQVLAETAMNRLSLAGTPCELELIFGLPDNKLRTVADTMNIPIRYYVPCGHGWPQFLIGQMRTNPSRTLSIALKAALGSALSR